MSLDKFVEKQRHEEHRGKETHLERFMDSVNKHNRATQDAEAFPQSNYKTIAAATESLYQAKNEMRTDPDIIYSNACPFDPFANWPDYDIIVDYDVAADRMDRDAPVITKALKTLGLANICADDQSTYAVSTSTTTTTITAVANEIAWP